MSRPDPYLLEWIVILVVALLIFGKRLPDVMKSIGKGIVEFKKGVKGIEKEVEEESDKKIKTVNKGLGAIENNKEANKIAESVICNSDIGKNASLKK